MPGRDSRQTIDEIINSIEKKGGTKKLDEKDCKILEEASAAFRKELETAEGTVSRADESSVLSSWNFAYRLWNVCAQCFKDKGRLICARIRRVASSLVSIVDKSHFVHDGATKAVLMWYQTALDFLKAQSNQAAKDAFDEARRRLIQHDNRKERNDKLLLDAQCGILKTTLPKIYEKRDDFGLLHSSLCETFDYLSASVKPQKSTIERFLQICSASVKYLLCAEGSNNLQSDRSLCAQALDCIITIIRQGESCAQILGTSDEELEHAYSLKSSLVLLYIKVGKFIEAQAEFEKLTAAQNSLESFEYLFLKLRIDVGQWNGKASFDTFCKIIKLGRISEEECLNALAVMIPVSRQEQIIQDLIAKLSLRFPKSKNLLRRAILIIVRTLTTNLEKHVWLAYSIGNMKQSLDLVSAVGEGKKFMNEMQVIFWNIGCDYFSKKAIDPARKMFEMFIKYSSSDDLNRASGHRMAGLCAIILGDQDIAQEHLSTSSQLEKDNAVTEFLLFKTYLLSKGGSEKASQCLRNLIECDNFESGYLRLAAHEALISGKYWLAIEALNLTLETEKMLLDGAMDSVEEVYLLRHMLYILRDRGRKGSSIDEPCTDTDGSSVGSSHTLIHDRAASAERFISMAYRSLSKAYQPGLVSQTVTKEILWFSYNGFQEGIEAFKEDKFELSNRIFQRVRKLLEIDKSLFEPALICSSVIMSICTRNEILHPNNEWGPDLERDRHEGLLSAMKDIQYCWGTVNRAKNESPNWGKDFLGITEGLILMECHLGIMLKDVDITRQTIESAKLSCSQTRVKLLELLLSHEFAIDQVEANTIEEWVACCQTSPADFEIQQLSKLTRKLVDFKFKSCLRGSNRNDSCYNILYQLDETIASNSAVLSLYPSVERNWLAASCCNAAIEINELKESKLSDLCMALALKFVENEATKQQILENLSELRK